jgi:hypothetical protein
MCANIGKIVATELRNQSCVRIVAKSELIIANSAATGVSCGRTEETCAGTGGIFVATGVMLAKTKPGKGAKGKG